MPTPPLFGRDRELVVLDQLLDRAPERGGALVVRGEAGIGKSALLAAASRRARERGMLVLTATGVQSEAHLPFAGLHQLLRPVLGGMDELPAPQRAAVHVAFGMGDAAAPDLFLIALATLHLLGDAAANAPLLIYAEDAQWLDRPTGDVLTFVARRLESDPIILLAAIREGFESPFDEAGLPELRLQGLDDSAAAALLDARAPDLTAAMRARLLAEAAGNALALVELPSALASRRLDSGAELPPWLPLTTRLEHAFAARVSDLPAATRMLLLVAALDDGGVLAEVLDAATLIVGSELTIAALDPAVAAGLVEVDTFAPLSAGRPELRFRHPLMRSAIHQAASPSQPRAAHAALARVLADQPDRCVWHQAASTIGPDEAVAAELDAAAARAQRRGGTAVAVAALERAAQLSEDPARRASRLVSAADVAFQMGRRDVVRRLVGEADLLELAPRDVGRLMWIGESFDWDSPASPAKVHALVEAAERLTADGDTELAFRLLWAAAYRCWWANPGSEARERVVASAERLGVPEDHPLAACGARVRCADRARRSHHRPHLSICAGSGRRPPCRRDTRQRRGDDRRVRGGEEPSYA